MRWVQQDSRRASSFGRLRMRGVLVVGCMALATLAACTAADETSDDGAQAASVDETVLAIRGSYVDPYQVAHVIDDMQWVMSSEFGVSVFEIGQYSNAEGYVVAHNGAANEYNAGEWSRFDWTYVGDALWICQVTYSSASEADALAVARADANDREGAGCGGYPWSLLSPAEPL